jgi:hypothetical protein
MEVIDEWAPQPPKVWCMKCPRDKMLQRVISAGHQWIVDCRDCSFTRYEGLGAKLAATVKAAKHMTGNGHEVWTYRTDLKKSLQKHIPEIGLFSQLNPRRMDTDAPF